MRVLDRRVVFEAFAAQTRLILTDLLTMSSHRLEVTDQVDCLLIR